MTYTQECLKLPNANLALFIQYHLHLNLVNKYAKHSQKTSLIANYLKNFS